LFYFNIVFIAKKSSIDVFHPCYQKEGLKFVDLGYTVRQLAMSESIGGSACGTSVLLIVSCLVLIEEAPKIPITFILVGPIAVTLQEVFGGGV
jgi:hypothetical protein